MTVDELLAQCATGDFDALAETLSGLEEQDRRTPFKSFEPFLKVWKRRDRHAPLGQQLPEEYQWLATAIADPNIHNVEWCVELAVLGLGPLSAARRVHMGFNERVWPALVRILDDRRPPWRAALLEDALVRRGHEVRVHWSVVRMLIDRGLCEKPDVEGYYYAMARTLAGLSWDGTLRENRKEYVLSDYLRERPELLEDVYRLFEVETDQFMDTGDPWHLNRARCEESWAHAIRTLADEGLLDRDRLLSVSLDALHRGFKQNLVSGIAAFHEGMKPSPGELAALQGAYRDLLFLESERAAAFGVKMLKEVEKAGVLDDAAYADAAGAALEKEGKGMARTVLAQCAAIGQRRPDLIPAMLDTIVNPGLVDVSSDIRTACVELIEGWSAHLSADHQAALADALADLPATIQEQARRLSGQAVPAPADSTPTEPLEALLDRVEALPARWRERAGVDIAMAALQSGEVAAPLAFDILETPIPAGLEPVIAIESVDELLDTVAAALEGVSSAMVVERILDGISRLGCEKPPEFAARAAPLLQRLEHLATWGNVRDSLIGPRRAPYGIVLLIAQWLGGLEAQRKLQQLEPAPIGPSPVLGPVVQGVAATFRAITGDWRGARRSLRGGPPPTIRTFQDARIRELLRRLEAGRTAPLLSLPTHAGGWIAPGVLVERIAVYQAAGTAPERLDTIQAFLRLSPSGRRAALERLAPTDETARALRWALGSDEGPRPGDKEVDCWLAAGRARMPHGDLDALARWRRQAPGPDGIVAGKISWEAISSETAAERPDGEWGIRRRVTPEPFTQTDDLARPTVLLHEHYHIVAASPAWRREWDGFTWPLYPAPYAAQGIRNVVSRIDNTAAASDPTFAYFGPLHHADMPLDRQGALLIAVGLSSRDQDACGAAKDVLIQAVADGRAHPDSFREAVDTITPAFWFKPGRISTHLADLGAVSPLHAWVAARLLEQVAVAMPNPEKDGHHAFAPLLELLTKIGLAVGPDTRMTLQNLQGSGKSAKLTRQLLALEPDDQAMQPVNAALLEARIVRAERWMTVNKE